MMAAAAGVEGMSPRVETVAYPYEDIQPKPLGRSAPSYVVSLAMAALICGTVHRMALRTVNELIDRHYEQRLAKIAEAYPLIAIEIPEPEAIASRPDSATAMTN